MASLLTKIKILYLKINYESSNYLSGWGRRNPGKHRENEFKICVPSNLTPKERRAYQGKHFREQEWISQTK